MRGVDFGNNQASSFTASVASGSQGGSIEMHLDSVDGPEIGSLRFHPRGDGTHGRRRRRPSPAPAVNVTSISCSEARRQVSYSTSITGNSTRKAPRSRNLENQQARSGLQMAQ